MLVPLRRPACGRPHCSMTSAIAAAERDYRPSFGSRFDSYVSKSLLSAVTSVGRSLSLIGCTLEIWIQRTARRHPPLKMHRHALLVHRAPTIEPASQCPVHPQQFHAQPIVVRLIGHAHRFLGRLAQGRPGLSQRHPLPVAHDRSTRAIDFSRGWPIEPIPPVPPADQVASNKTCGTHQGCAALQLARRRQHRQPIVRPVKPAPYTAGCSTAQLVWQASANKRIACSPHTNTQRGKPSAICISQSVHSVVRTYTHPTTRRQTPWRREFRLG